MPEDGVISQFGFSVLTSSKKFHLSIAKWCDSRDEATDRPGLSLPLRAQ